VANSTAEVLSWASKSILDKLSTIDRLLAAVGPIPVHGNLGSANDHVVRVIDQSYGRIWGTPSSTRA
jgi:hypothetical protein